MTQEQYTVLSQKNRELKISVKLLNKQYQIIEEISGVVVNAPTISATTDSNCRLSGDISLIVTDSTFEIKEDGKIWLDKMVQIVVELKSNITNEYVPFNLGIYVLGSTNRVYNATTNTLNLQLLDLMNLCNGVRGGNLLDTYVIPQDSNIRESFIAILNELGFEKYIISDVDQLVPNQITKEGTYFDLMNDLVNILPKYQIYFDTEGVFHYEPIPINENEVIVVDDNLLQQLLLSYNVAVDFSTIYNVVKVVGDIHEVGVYGGDVEAVNHVYSFNSDKIDSYDSNYKIGFTTLNGSSSPFININSLGAKDVMTEDYYTPLLASNRYYVFRYDEYSDRFILLGEIEPKYIAKDTNEASPFNIYKLGEIPLFLSGNDYDNITTDRLAKERAEWKLYHSTRLKDNVQITILPIYSLKINDIIEITLPNKNGIETKKQYIIQNISTQLGVSGTQTITMCPYYPFYV